MASTSVSCTCDIPSAFCPIHHVAHGAPSCRCCRVGLPHHPCPLDISKKRERDLDSELLSDEVLPPSKRAKVDNKEEEAETTTTSTPLVLQEYEEWFHDEKDFCTLTVHVKLFDPHGYNPKQTGVMHLHCVPGALATHSKYFTNLILLDKDLKEVELPDSFSYETVRSKGAHGIATVSHDQVMHLFKVMHGQERLNNMQVGFRTMLMTRYICADLLYNQIEHGDGWDFSRDPITYLLWAHHFKSDYLFNLVSSAILHHRYNYTKVSKDETKEYIKELPKEVLEKFMIRYMGL